MKRDVIYFVRSGDAVKIGFTSDLEARLRVLRTDTAGEIELLAVMEGDRREEARLHADFKHLRIKREWFRAEEELLAFIGLVNTPVAGAPLPQLVFDKAALEALGL